MKNLFKFLGIISLVLVIGFSMAACSDDGDDDGPVFDGTWTEKDDTGAAEYTVSIKGDDITITSGDVEFKGKLGEEVSVNNAGGDSKMRRIFNADGEDVGSVLWADTDLMGKFIIVDIMDDSIFGSYPSITHNL